MNTWDHLTYLNIWRALNNRQLFLYCEKMTSLTTAINSHLCSLSQAVVCLRDQFIRTAKAPGIQHGIQTVIVFDTNKMIFMYFSDYSQTILGLYSHQNLCVPKPPFHHVLLLCPHRSGLVYIYSHFIV